MLDPSKTPDTSLLDDVREQKIEKTKDEAAIPLTIQDSLELDEIIRLGTSYIEEFKTKDGQIIRIRPLSIAEKNKAMYKGLLEIANTKTLKKIWGNLNLKEGIEKKLTVEDELNLLLFTEEESAWLTMLSMRDFDEQIAEIIEKNGEKKAVQILKRNIDELGKLSRRIKEISGLTENSRETVEAFQEDISGLGDTLRIEGNKPRHENINTKSDPSSKDIPRTKKKNGYTGNE